MSVLSNLNPRERVLVLGGGLLLLVLILWRFAWQPIQQERAEIESDLARYLMLAQVADEAGTGTTAGAGAAAALPLPQRVTRSADAAGVPLARLDPEGGRLRVVVERVPFDVLIGWIETLEGPEAARIVALEVERLAEPGVVTARVTVEDA